MNFFRWKVVVRAKEIGRIVVKYYARLDYSQRVYRLPKFHRENEVERFNKVFHSIPPTKKKFIKYMAAYLQDKVAAPVNAESSKVGKTPTYIKLKDFLLLK